MEKGRITTFSDVKIRENQEKINHISVGGGGGVMHTLATNCNFEVLDFKKFSWRSMSPRLPSLPSGIDII